jgi:AraC-like DNA-binding protein
MDYSVWMHVWHINKKVTMLPVSPNDALALNYMIKGKDIACILTGFGPVTLKTNRYQLFYVPSEVYNEAIFEPGIYIVVHINFHPTHLIPIAEQYPLFHPMLEQAQHKMREGSTQEQAAITRYMRKLIDEIIHSDLGVGERSLFIGAKIRELLRLYIRDQGLRQQLPAVSKRQEVLLDEMEKYILANLDTDLTVQHLARQFNVGRSWLQRITHRRYGMGIHELVIDKRMNEAAKLLVTTNMPVSEICQHVSQMTFSAFSAAFLKYFGQTPLAFKKSGGHKRQK